MLSCRDYFSLQFSGKPTYLVWLFPCSSCGPRMVHEMRCSHTRSINISLDLPARAGRSRHTFPPSARWNWQGISRLVGARAKPGVPGARADCPPSQPLAWLCASRHLSSVSIEKSWSCTSTGESTLASFPPGFLELKSCALTSIWIFIAPRWHLEVSRCTFPLICSYRSF